MTRYILKSYVGSGPLLIDCPDYRVRYPEILRETERVGPFRTLMGTGKFDASRLELCTLPGLHYAPKVPATAAGVKSVLRELRPQEAEALDALDAEITALSEALKAKKAERRAFLKTAFQKGHVVRLATVLEKVPEGKK